MSYTLQLRDDEVMEFVPIASPRHHFALPVGGSFDDITITVSNCDSVADAASIVRDFIEEVRRMAHVAIAGEDDDSGDELMRDSA